MNKRERIGKKVGYWRKRVGRKDRIKETKEKRCTTNTQESAIITFMLLHFSISSTYLWNYGEPKINLLLLITAYLCNSPAGIYSRCLSAISQCPVMKPMGMCFMNSTWYKWRYKSKCKIRHNEVIVENAGTVSQTGVLLLLVRTLLFHILCNLTNILYDRLTARIIISTVMLDKWPLLTLHIKAISE